MVADTSNGARTGFERRALTARSVFVVTATPFTDHGRHTGAVGSHSTCCHHTEINVRTALPRPPSGVAE